MPEDQKTPVEQTTTERVVTEDGANVQQTATAVSKEERPVTPRTDHKINIAERIVWILGGIVIALLALRFILRVLGADPNNGFADFIYTLSYPLAAPFFGLFNYNVDLTTGRFEFETLIGIVIYALLAWLIAKLVTIGRR